MISKRIKELGSIIPACDRIIDVGCDHALLDIYLAEKYKNTRFLATDISKNALNNAKNNILSSNLESRIETKLTDGLNDIELFKTDFIVISGMGTNTIIKILQPRLSEINNVIIQTNRDLEKLRSFMFQNGFGIVQEKVVFDEHYYVFIHFNRKPQKYEKVDLWLGPIIKHSKNNSYFENLLKKYQKMFNGIPENTKRKNEIGSRIKILENLIEKK